MYILRHNSGFTGFIRRIDAVLYALEMSEELNGHFTIYKEGVKTDNFIHGKRTYPEAPRQRAYHKRDKKKFMTASA